MSTISLRVPEEELVIMKNYASLNNESLSSIIRSIVLDKIEEEYDLQVFAEYEQMKENGELDTRPINELWRELEL